MLVFVICLALIARSQNTTQSLVESVEDTLETCTEILDLVNAFNNLHNYTGALRRISGFSFDDNDQLVDALEEKLGACSDIVFAVDNFRIDYPHFGRDEEPTNDDPIVLNIGGTHFATTRETLLAVNGSVFEKMLSDDSNFTVSADGSYFIDRSPGTFTYIIDYLRNGDFFIKNDDPYLRRQLLADVEYYGLPEELIDYLEWTSVPRGIDLTMSEVTFINEQLRLESKELGDMIYRASVHGDLASDFHSYCDGKGPTVVIVETDYGNVFGGYTFT